MELHSRVSLPGTGNLVDQHTTNTQKNALQASLRKCAIERRHSLFSKAREVSRARQALVVDKQVFETGLWLADTTKLGQDRKRVVCVGGGDCIPRRFSNREILLHKHAHHRTAHLSLGPWPKGVCNYTNLCTATYCM